jgi:outer membrane protein assembly factor BamD
MLKLYVYFVILCHFSWFACTEERFDPNDPKKSYGIAKAPYDDENYEIALQKLGEFKTRFPYSQYATEAELLIANSHFFLKQFAEAAAAYETFVKLHPKHPEVDYAMFRVGESHWQESPEEIDREQDFTKLAVSSWQKLLETKPESKFSAEAKEKISLGQRRLAESDDFIARFYCKKDLYHACAARSMKLAEQFEQFSDLKNASLKRAAMALDELAKIKEADPSSDKNLYFKTLSAGEIRKKAADLRAQIKS